MLVNGTLTEDIGNHPCDDFANGCRLSGFMRLLFDLSDPFLNEQYESDSAIFYEPLETGRALEVTVQLRRDYDSAFDDLTAFHSRPIFVDWSQVWGESTTGNFVFTPKPVVDIHLEYRYTEAAMVPLPGTLGLLVLGLLGYASMRRQ